MKHIIFISFLLICSTIYAKDPFQISKEKVVENIAPENPITFSRERFIFLDSLKQEMQEENAQQKRKSGIKAALFSAIFPGWGEYYAESYWKSAVFAALEVISITSFIVYTDKGKTKDTEMRNFGDEKWSEQQYWTNIYEDATGSGKWSGETGEFDNGDPSLLTESFINANMSPLRNYEKNYHTHTLPSTKTQQYYEMIYKYLGQFGAGWTELNEPGYGWDYYDNLGVELTADVERYRKLRVQSNGFYETATTFANVAMFNHLVSALDAAWSVKQYNTSINLSLMAESKYYAGQHVASYGISVSW